MASVLPVEILEKFESHALLQLNPIESDLWEWVHEFVFVGFLIGILL
jgi:hypothetical protein